MMGYSPQRGMVCRVRPRHVLVHALRGLIAVITLFTGSAVTAGSFIPIDPVLLVEHLRPGMVGVAKTVVRGEKIVEFPVEILDVLARQGTPRHLVLIRAFGPLMDQTGGIAAGMSGSPVYVGGKLIGAIGYGWEFSDHRLGLVTPVEDMAEIWKWLDRLPPFRTPMPLSFDRNQSTDLAECSPEWRPLRSPLVADGFNSRATAHLTSSLGTPILQGSGSPPDMPLRYGARPKPGASVGVLLAWGDVTLGATGTLSAVDRDGRFVAFAHPLLTRGTVAYPLTDAVVHGVVPSMEAPFKLGTPQAIIGIVTQDRPQAIGGYFGRFAPAVDFSVTVRDSDTRRVIKKRFHVVDDPFLLEELAPEAMLSILDNAWERLGQGTAYCTLQVEGGGLAVPWRRENMFFSPQDPISEATKEFREITRIFALNEFRDVRPLGIHVDVELSTEPRILFVEHVDLSSREVAPGKSVDVTVTLRPYRREAFRKKFTLRVPEKASGVYEIVVRGGGIAEPDQDSLLQGWRAITDFSSLLAELSAKESNNELVVELLGEDAERKDRDPSDLSPSDEEQLLLSELQQKRHREGTLRTFRTNYFVEGLLRRTVRILETQEP